MCLSVFMCMLVGVFVCIYVCACPSVCCCASLCAWPSACRRTIGGPMALKKTVCQRRCGSTVYQAFPRYNRQWQFYSANLCHATGCRRGVWWSKQANRPENRKLRKSHVGEGCEILYGWCTRIVGCSHAGELHRSTRRTRIFSYVLCRRVAALINRLYMGGILC